MARAQGAPRGISATLSRYAQEWWLLVRDPVTFFVTLDSRTTRAWPFFLTFAWPGAVLGYLLRKHSSSHLSAEAFRLRAIVAFVLAPLVLTAIVMLIAAVHHLLLTLGHGSSAGFGETRRVVLYALTAYYALHWIPVVGFFIALWRYVRLLLVGFELRHETTHVRAAFAAAAPYLLVMLGALAF